MRAPRGRTRTYGFMGLQLAIPFLFAACTGGDTGDGSRSGAAGDASVTQAAGTRPHACELLTAEEVAAVHGAAVVAAPGDDDGPYRSSCLYSPPGSTEWQVMWLTVHWRGGREEWETQQGGRAIGTRMMSVEGHDVDSITRPDPLAGIGDAAYYGGILPSLVLEGDVLLEFMMPLLRNDREHFPELAKKAVSRL